MNKHCISLVCSSRAEYNAYKTLETISKMYQNRDDYRIIGGQMVNLLLALYPVEEMNRRATQDADTAIADIELLLLADEELIKAGFIRIKGGVYSHGALGSPDYQEINYIKAEESTKRQIHPVKVSPTGTRVVDAMSSLVPVLASPDALRINAEIKVPRGENFRFSVVIPQLEFAVLLKAQALVDRGYLEKNLFDLLTLFEIQEAHRGESSWPYSDENIKGRRKDTVQNLHIISRHLRRNTCVGFSQGQADRLRYLIGVHTVFI